MPRGPHILRVARSWRTPRGLGALVWRALGLAGMLYIGCVNDVQANPRGMTVVNGSVTASTTGPRLQITASDNSVINWQSFNIGTGETTSFHQPSAASIVWNRIYDANPSRIYGTLNANGIVVLMNRSGFYFGPNSFVNAAGLVVTTALPPPDVGMGGFWQYNGPPPAASIVNYGHVNIGKGGSAFLIAERVENHGAIEAPEGTIGLYAGKDVLISQRPDGRGLSAEVRLPEGSVDNHGQLIADGGTIALHARTVNQNGIIQANSVRQRNGVIELFASESVNLGPQSHVSARGDAVGASDGGAIRVKSEGSFKDANGSEIVVTGGAQGGNGGEVEVSAPRMTAIQSKIQGEAASGWAGGRLFIDPTDIFLSTSGDGSAGTGTVNANDPPDVLRLNVNSAFTGFSQINLQATRNITLESGTRWDLNQSTGASTPNNLLTLAAGNDISVQNDVSLVAGDNWSVAMTAGADFASPGNVVAGTGGIYFQGNGSLETRNGSVTLKAGKEVAVNSGFVRTVGGGSIAVTAVSGSVSTGTKQNGFLFDSSGDRVDPDLGGISTAHGGDVTIDAGEDIIAVLPQSGVVQRNGGAGAFGTEAGDVTLNSGRDVIGHFVVGNGTGRITAHRDAGTRERALALSLIAGGWDVRADRDILLQEVRNPNGIFNAALLPNSPVRHRFDYSLSSYTRLDAGRAVNLQGGALPRNAGAGEQAVPCIYPPSLEITAGAGGVAVGRDVILFPSPEGGLKITTSDGGSLFGSRAAGLSSLIVSDSGRSQYSESAFGLTDHATIPVHLDSTAPYAVELNIDGDMNNILIGSPAQAAITVKGDMRNSRFSGQHLRPTDTTLIRVNGDIWNRNEFTTVSTTQVPDFTVFDRLDPELGNVAGLRELFTYNAVNGTMQLTFQGRMTTEVLHLLTTLRVVKLYPGYDPLRPETYVPVLDANGNLIIEPAVFADTAALNAIFAASQDIPDDAVTGYLLGGPGKLRIEARNLELGATAGIVSRGPAFNAALARLSTTGADIDIRLAGDLNMFSTAISSLSGGNISVDAGGTINAGSETYYAPDALPRGIFTVAKSDVTVVATGDININGSRIAAYDGGNITVLSRTGNVDAGSGGQGAVRVDQIVVDQESSQVRVYSSIIPGSGILATTFPPSFNPAIPSSTHAPGNITVETPNGNVNARAGGIVQVALNGNRTQSTVKITAGSKDPITGDVLFQGDINAEGSGIIGGNVKLEATGAIKGVVVASGNADISAIRSVNVTALAQGNVSVQAETVSGTIIGVGSVSASGGTIDASLLSQNVNAANATGEVGFGQGKAAGTTSQSVQGTEEAARKTAIASTEEGEDDKKKRGTIRLAKNTGRVTVILPQK